MKAKNYKAVMHDENYLDQYSNRPLTHKTMRHDRFREKQSLNGLWKFTIDPYDTCMRQKWWSKKSHNDDGLEVPLDFHFESWEDITVPSCWNMIKPEFFWYEGSAVYTREFSYLSNSTEERVFLKVGATSYESFLFLNGEFLGSHKGASTPYFIDVTDNLKELNHLLIVVNNSRISTRVPMNNTDWFNYGGLYRDIELIRLPGSYIKEFSLGFADKECYDKLLLKVQVDGDERNANCSLGIKELGVKETLKIKDGYGELIIKATPQLWSPDTPKLYDVELSYMDDTVVDKIGFKTITTRGTSIYLNGEELKLKGIATHEESLSNGKSMTEEEIRENFSLAKEMNANFVRLAHYPHTEEAAYIADEVGILLWEEIPVYWAIDFSNEITYNDAENQLTELIKRDINRASVMIWSIGNENADTDERLDFMRRLSDRARELDGSRLISAACLWNFVDLKIDDRLTVHLDIVGINEYFGWYSPEFENIITLFENTKPDKPIIISEFGGGAKAGTRGKVTEMYTEEFQEEIYKKQVETLSKTPYVAGITPWILYDFRCPRRMGKNQEFYNRKGLLSEDKTEKKLAYYAMKEFYGSY